MSQGLVGQALIEGAKGRESGILSSLEVTLAGLPIGAGNAGVGGLSRPGKFMPARFRPLAIACIPLP